MATVAINMLSMLCSSSHWNQSNSCKTQSQDISAMNHGGWATPKVSWSSRLEHVWKGWNHGSPNGIHRVLSTWTGVESCRIQGLPVEILVDSVSIAASFLLMSSWNCFTMWPKTWVPQRRCPGEVQCHEGQTFQPSCTCLRMTPNIESSWEKSFCSMVQFHKHVLHPYGSVRSINPQTILAWLRNMFLPHGFGENHFATTRLSIVGSDAAWNRSRA